MPSIEGDYLLIYYDFRCFCQIEGCKNLLIRVQLNLAFIGYNLQDSYANNSR